MKASKIILPMLMLLFMLLGGCETVKPWQREALADPIMQPGRNPISAARAAFACLWREWESTWAGSAKNSPSISLSPWPGSAELVM